LYLLSSFKLNVSLFSLQLTIMYLKLLLAPYVSVSVAAACQLCSDTAVN